MEPDVLDWAIFRADQGDAVHHCEDGERLCGYGEEWVHDGIERITEDTEKKREHGIHSVRSRAGKSRCAVTIIVGTRKANEPRTYMMTAPST
jgi:hypothetical protein